MEYRCEHGCAMCDGLDMRYEDAEYVSGEKVRVWWICGNCGATHCSQDCCTPTPTVPIIVEPPKTMQEAEKLLEELRP